MFKLFMTYSRFSKEFEGTLINVKKIGWIDATNHELDNDAPIGTKSIINHDAGYIWCSQSVSELNTLINGH